jgi:hypothetical protein
MPTSGVSASLFGTTFDPSLTLAGAGVPTKEQKAATASLFKEAAPFLARLSLLGDQASIPKNTKLATVLTRLASELADVSESTLSLAGILELATSRLRIAYSDKALTDADLSVARSLIMAAHPNPAIHALGVSTFAERIKGVSTEAVDLPKAGDAIAAPSYTPKISKIGGGTEKQIAWAERIRDGATKGEAGFTSALSALSALSQNPPSYGSESAAQKQREAIAEVMEIAPLLLDPVAKEPRANFWIDNRDTAGADLPDRLLQSVAGLRLDKDANEAAGWLVAAAGKQEGANKEIAPYREKIKAWGDALDDRLFDADDVGFPSSLSSAAKGDLVSDVARALDEVQSRMESTSQQGGYAPLMDGLSEATQALAKMQLADAVSAKDCAVMRAVIYLNTPHPKLREFGKKRLDALLGDAK